MIINNAIFGGGTPVNAKVYDINLPTHKSSWVKLAHLDDEVIQHIDDDTFVVALYNVSPYVYDWYAGSMYLCGNITQDSTGITYGMANRTSSETSTLYTRIIYPAKERGRYSHQGSYAQFQFDEANGDYYIMPGDGFIKAGNYRLVFTW